MIVFLKRVELLVTGRVAVLWKKTLQWRKILKKKNKKPGILIYLVLV